LLVHQVQSLVQPSGPREHVQATLFRFCNIGSNTSNTSNSVLSGYPNTEKRVEKYDVQQSILTQFEVFG